MTMYDSRQNSAFIPNDSNLKCTRFVVHCNSETTLDNADAILEDNSSLKVSSYSGKAARCLSSYDCSGISSYRFQLEQDVQKLQQQLQEETQFHSILDSFENNAVDLFSLSCLPQHALQLLSSITLLHSTISELEHELISLHFQLSQERNERRLAEYYCRHSSTQLQLPCPDAVKAPQAEDLLVLQEQRASLKMDIKCTNTMEGWKISRELLSKDILLHPCILSEDMVRCMRTIFISLADSSFSSKSSKLESAGPSSSPLGYISNLSTWSLLKRSLISSWVLSPHVDLQFDAEVLAAEETCDPYKVPGKLNWADIGIYRFASEVSWMSVGRKQLEFAAGGLRRFRTLLEQLAQVNPVHLSSNEKLAFWINLYNALIMHAYLAYGVPRSDLKLFSLMQKAAYTVGGHSFNAAAIEYVILKMKPPVHRPQIALLLALHKLKVSEVKQKFAIDDFEPLLTFALSCGMYSMPAIKIYTAKNIREELLESQRDFIRASVGMSSRGRLLVPTMLHCFARGIVNDENLAVWISQYFPPKQAAFIEKCMSQRQQNHLGSGSIGIIPFDFCFRYLFLSENHSS